MFCLDQFVTQTNIFIIVLPNMLSYQKTFDPQQNFQKNLSLEKFFILNWKQIDILASKNQVIYKYLYCYEYKTSWYSDSLKTRCCKFIV